MAVGVKRTIDLLRFKLRTRCLKRVTVRDGERQYLFECESPVEIWRARTLLVKEEGTIRWLRSLRAGDVFYDVGANIGLYTLFGGSLVGIGGLVCAFEPHAANLHSLLRNVALNDLNSRVKVLSCALNDTEGIFPFNYNAALAGSSMSQLNGVRDDKNLDFEPVFVEYKYATSVDRLMDAGAIPAPNMVKIDVDGNELLVLQGMSRLLTGAQRPRSLQVEVNESHCDELMRFMRDHEYQIILRHYTAAGEAKRAGSKFVSYNAVFEPIRSNG